MRARVVCILPFFQGIAARICSLHAVRERPKNRRRSPAAWFCGRYCCPRKSAASIGIALVCRGGWVSKARSSPGPVRGRGRRREPARGQQSRQAKGNPVHRSVLPNEEQRIALGRPVRGDYRESVPLRQPPHEEGPCLQKI